MRHIFRIVETRVSGRRWRVSYCSPTLLSPKCPICVNSIKSINTLVYRSNPAMCHKVLANTSASLNAPFSSSPSHYLTCFNILLLNLIIPFPRLPTSSKSQVCVQLNMTRRLAKDNLVPPTLDQDAAERKRVLNILAQRRYSECS